MHGHFQAKPVVKNLKWFSHLEKDNELCELCLMKNDVKLEMWIASCQPFSGNFFCTFSTEKQDYVQGVKLEMCIQVIQWFAGPQDERKWAAKLEGSLFKTTHNSAAV